MQSQLTRFLPKDQKKAQALKEEWERAGVLLEPLALALKEQIDKKEVIAEDDFAVSNHYALLAYRAGQVAMAKRILELLPESVK